MTHYTRNILFLLCLLSIPTNGAFCAQSASDGANRRIVVVKTRDIPFYTQALQGFTNGLKTRGHGNKEKTEIRTVALNGDEKADVRRVRDLVAEKPALIVTLGTDATRLVADEKPVVPVLFAMILDPVSLGIVHSLEEPGGNFTGTTLTVNTGKQLDALLQAVPTVRRIGLLYTDKDAISLAFLKEAKQEAGRQKTEVVSIPVSAETTTAEALSTLKGKVDALWLIPDPASSGPKALKATMDFASANRLPVLGSSSGAVRSGALLALSADLQDAGDTTAEMAVFILNKTETTAVLRVRGPRRTTLSINLIAARALNIRIPPAILHLADEVIDSETEEK